MEYLHLFKTKSAHDAARSYGEGGEYKEPWVAYVDDGSKLVTYNKGLTEKYLTFKALEDGTFSFTKSGVNYSIDGGETWTELAANTGTPTVSAGGTIMFKATLTPETSNGIGHFVSTGRYEVMGNPYSLLYGDGFESVRDLTGKNGALRQLFSGSTGLTSAENLSLPATTLAQYCYYYMFNGCTSLTTAPELPATTLADFCYTGMFIGCTSLTTAPELPATTLTGRCYTSMFRICTSLTTAPELPATTLNVNCYSYMFNGCTSLTTAPELPATTLDQSCYNSMFGGCTSLTTAPELPATTLANSCYESMFGGCTTLNYIKAMFTTTPSSTYTSNWVNGVASTGTFVKNSAAEWTTTGVDGIPTGWTVETASA